MNSLWRAIGLGGSSIPNFDFTIDETATATALSNDALLPWMMRPGKRNEDGLVVTVFSLSLTGRDNSSIEMARNVLRKCKTLMLPGFLRTLDATEYKDTIYIATESVVPLKAVISNDSAKIEFYEEASGEKYNNAVALGLKYVAQALNGIHKHNLVHGNIGPEEVFVTKGGEWKVFGLELVGTWNEDHSLLKRNAALLPEYRRVAVQAEPCNIYDIDAWGLGCLIYTVFSSSAASTSPKSIKVTDMKGCRTMPRTLQAAFMSLTGTNPKLRMSFGKFLEECEFISGSEFVQMVSDLDNLAVTDAVDRDNLYRKLSQQMDDVPLCACKHIVLAKLLTALSFGGGSAAVLEPILKIGARLQPEEFSQHIGPIVTNMFTSQDHMVRCRLLSSSSEYAKLLPADLVNDKIYPQFQTGFTSRHADIRELTVRALVDFAPLLRETILVNDVPRHIATLQQDREGPIRTNATICLSLIAPHLPESVRGKTLVNGFGRMLKDPFVPSRTAAIRSISTTLSQYAAQQLAEMLLPAVCPCTVDAHAEVREAALGLMGDIMKRLNDNHRSMPSVGPDGQPLGSPASPATAEAAAAANASGWGSMFSGLTASSPTPSVASAPTPASPPPSVKTPAPTPTTSNPVVATITKPSRPTMASAAAINNAPTATTATTVAKAGNGWGDDDDELWGQSKGSTSSNPTNNTASKPSVTSAPPTTSTIRKPTSASQQMDDFFGSPSASANNNNSGGTPSLNNTLSGTSTGSGIVKPSGGAMKLGLGGTKKLGLGLGSKAE